VQSSIASCARAQPLEKSCTRAKNSTDALSIAEMTTSHRPSLSIDPALVPRYGPQLHAAPSPLTNNEESLLKESYSNLVHSFCTLGLRPFFLGAASATGAATDEDDAGAAVTTFEAATTGTDTAASVSTATAADLGLRPRFLGSTTTGADAYDSLSASRSCL
jgi:hypothetical protein